MWGFPKMLGQKKQKEKEIKNKVSAVVTCGALW